MDKEQAIKELTAHFHALGARDPESWASSQIKEGIPQYARYVFLRQAWKSVISEGAISWIDVRIVAAQARPNDPGAGIGPALERLLAAGASPADISEVVRVMQWQVLSRLMYQLSDFGAVEYPGKDQPRVKWELFEVDEKGKPLHPINGLHESVLDTDPSGREMRPRPGQ